MKKYNDIDGVLLQKGIDGVVDMHKNPRLYNNTYMCYRLGDFEDQGIIVELSWEGELYLLIHERSLHAIKIKQDFWLFEI
jgi:hypothetical protein